MWAVSAFSGYSTKHFVSYVLKTCINTSIFVTCCKFITEAVFQITEQLTGITCLHRKTICTCSLRLYMRKPHIISKTHRGPSSSSSTSRPRVSPLSLGTQQTRQYLPPYKWCHKWAPQDDISYTVSDHQPLLTYSCERRHNWMERKNGGIKKICRKKQWFRFIHCITKSASLRFLPVPPSFVSCMMWVAQRKKSFRGSPCI